MIDENILARFDTLIQEAEQLIVQIKTDDQNKRRQMRGIMAVGFEFHDRGVEAQAFTTRFKNLIESLQGNEQAEKVLQEVESHRYMSTRLEKMLGTLRGMKSDYENGLITFPVLLGSKEYILQEFDQMIDSLQVIVQKLPDNGHDRYRRRSGTNTVPDGVQRDFLAVRTECLKLLVKIDSEDIILKQTVDFIRDIEIHPFNIHSVLRKMQSLRSDYDADILTHFPRIPETTPKSKEKPAWLNEPRAIIIAGLIGAFATLVATIIAIAIGGNSTETQVTPQNEITITAPASQPWETEETTQEIVITEETTEEP